MVFNKQIITFLILSIIIISCRYSFTGSSVPLHLKTITIHTFIDRSGSGEPDLSSKITNQLTQKFINDNSLQVIDGTNSDCTLEGTITSLTESPAVISGNETITTQRITINVHVIYKDQIKRETIFERDFTNYTDYKIDSSNIINARKTAIEETIDKITDDILIGVVSNW